jgi:hypothetical protein
MRKEEVVAYFKTLFQHLLRGAKLNLNKARNVHINITLKRVRVTTVVVEKQYVLQNLTVCL